MAVINGTNGNDQLDGTVGDDVIFGYDGDDILRGGPGKDSLYGGSGDDSLYGGGGGDVVDGQSGDDFLSAYEGTAYGGSGRDTAQFLGAAEHYDITKGPEGLVTVTDTFPDPTLIRPSASDGYEGTTRLYGVEQAQFLDRTLYWDGRNNAPIGVDDTAQAAAGQATVIPASSLLANDRDIDGDPLTITAVGNSPHGTVALTPQGDVMFTPQPGYSGQAPFDYVVGDNHEGRDNVRVAVQVEGAAPTPGPDILYFSNGDQLWAFDGAVPHQAAAGDFTSVRDIHALGASDVYFTAEDPVHGRELWHYDGNQARLAADIFPGAENPQNDVTILGEVGDKLYFRQDDGVHGAELWQAQAGQVTRLTDINPGSGGSDPRMLTPMGDSVYFTANDPEHGTEMWRLGPDGQPERVTDIAPGAASTYFGDAVAVGDRLFFTVGGQNYDEPYSLWTLMANGAPERIDLGSSAVSRVQPLATDGDRLFFLADDPVQGTQLWQWQNGQAQVLADLDPAHNWNEQISDIAIDGNRLYVVSYSGQGDGRVARYDIDSHAMTPNIAPDPQSFPQDLTIANGRAYFTADNHVSNGDYSFRDLWMDDGLKTERIDLADDRVTFPREPTAAGDKLYFIHDGAVTDWNGQAFTEYPLPAGTGSFPYVSNLAPVHDGLLIA